MRGFVPLYPLGSIDVDRTGIRGRWDKAKSMQSARCCRPSHVPLDGESGDSASTKSARSGRRPPT